MSWPALSKEVLEAKYARVYESGMVDKMRAVLICMMGQIVYIWWNLDEAIYF